MKKIIPIICLVVTATELYANPVAPKSHFGFNSGWTIIVGLCLEFVIAYPILKKYLTDRREFIFRFLGMHVATLPVCYIMSQLDYFTPWLLAQSVVIFIEAWFYTKAPGNPKWRISLLTSFIANVSSASFAIVTHRL
jgi:hypothetical protein